ncbi:MAG: FMN-binding protein, partial [Tissierellia bacterium]|nr:FMN-binding protein [Tissierellia bacterium]
LIEHFNGLGKEGEKVIPIILEEQSLKVDVISGATTSSMAIIKSVETSLEERNE